MRRANSGGFDGTPFSLMKTSKCGVGVRYTASAPNLAFASRASQRSSSEKTRHGIEHAASLSPYITNIASGASAAESRAKFLTDASAEHPA